MNFIVESHSPHNWNDLFLWLLDDFTYLLHGRPSPAHSLFRFLLLEHVFHLLVESFLAAGAWTTPTTAIHSARIGWLELNLDVLELLAVLMSLLPQA